MTPQELILKLADGEITSAEWDELRQQVEGDSAAADEVCALLEVETMLRGQAPRDVTAATMQRLDEELSQRIGHAVLDAVNSVDDDRDEDNGIASLQRLAARENLSRIVREARRSQRVSRFFLGLLGLSCAVLVVIAFWTPGWLQPDGEYLATGPTIIRNVGKMELESSGNLSSSAIVGRVIRSRDRLQLTDPESGIRLRYPDGTEVELSGESDVSFSQSSASGKRLELRRGQLLADVSPQPAGRPLMIVTPHGSVRVLGTKLEVVAADQYGMRVDLKEGHVEVERNGESPVPVGSGSVAIVPSDRSPIVVKPRSLLLTRPRRDIAVSGLRSICFARDQRTVLGATHSQAVFISEDDHVEVVPVLEHGQKQSRQQVMTQHVIAFSHAHEHRSVLWDAMQRRRIHVLEWKADAPKSERVIRAVSPHGDWFVSALRSEMHAHDRTKQFRFHDLRNGSFTDITRPVWLSDFQSSPDGSMLAIGHSQISGPRAPGNAVELIDTSSLESQARLPVQAVSPWTVRFSASGEQLAVGTSAEVQVWNIPDQLLIAAIGDLTIYKTGVALSPDGRIVAATSGIKSVSLWNVDTKTELARIELEQHVSDLHITPDGRSVAVLERSGRLTVWDISNVTLEPAGHNEE